MKRINQAILQRGDIILTTSDAKESKVVRVGTFSDISHAMICVANGSVMDSTLDGVHARNIQKILFNDEWPVYVLRLKAPISVEKIDQIASYARSQTATSYSMVSAAISVFRPFWAGGRRQFCSRLIARAYASVGVELNGNPEFCTPARLKRSPKLVALENPTVSVSKEEAEILEQIGDVTQQMRDITNELIGWVRQIIPSVQSLNDIDVALIANPDLDAQVAAIFQESGYLDFWKVEPEKRPWRYTMELMHQMHSLIQKSLPEDDCLAEYCRQTLKADEAGDFKHWMVEMDKYMSYDNQFSLQTFRHLRATYWNLIRYHAMRVNTAQTYLRWLPLLDKQA